METRKGQKVFGVLFAFALVALIIFWLLRGRTTVTGQFPANIVSRALVCEQSGKAYSKTLIGEDVPKHLKVNLVFAGEDALRTLSLIYTTNHSSPRAAEIAEAWAHAEFNRNLYASGYNAEKFTAKFAIFDSDLILTLYASAGELDETSAPYFLLDFSNSASAPKTLADFRAFYESAGFTCSTNNNLSSKEES